MKTEDLEHLIRETFRNIYNADYKGKLNIEKSGKGFLIELGMQTPEYPIVLYTELCGKKLEDFIKEELRNRAFVSFMSIQSIYPSTKPCNTNKRCDTR